MKEKVSRQFFSQIIKRKEIYFTFQVQQKFSKLCPIQNSPYFYSSLSLRQSQFPFIFVFFMSSLKGPNFRHHFIGSSSSMDLRYFFLTFLLILFLQNILNYSLVEVFAILPIFNVSLSEYFAKTLPPNIFGPILFTTFYTSYQQDLLHLSMSLNRFTCVFFPFIHEKALNQNNCQFNSHFI